MPALFRRFSGGKPAASPFRTRLSAEPLEDRTVPATFTVTDLGDAGAGTLRDAVDQANANPGADDIVFAVTGTIALTSGQIDIVDDLTIAGGGAIVLDGGAAQRIFSVDSDTTLTGLTLRNGLVTGEAGGAVVVYYGENLTVRDTTFSGNSADQGGAVFASGQGAVRLFGTTFTGNTATAEDGGAVSAVDNVTLEVENSTFSGNTSLTDDGGAIYLEQSFGFVVRGSTFTGNTATEDGGAIAVERMRGNVLIENSTLTGNTAGEDGGALYFGRLYTGNTITIANTTISQNISGDDGGGVYVEDLDGTFRLVGSTLADNVADDDGGGLAVYDVDQSAVVEITRSVISGNRGEDGGGVYLYMDEGSVTVTDSTISGNIASGDGGGLCLYYEDDSSILTSLTIVGSDISGNTAGDDGGGVFVAFYYADVYGNFTFRDTTISGNTAGGDGGGVHFALNSDGSPRSLVGTLLFDGVTITGNTAAEGGGINLDGGSFQNPVVIANANISGNTATGSDGGGLDIYGAFYGGLQFTNTTIAGNTASNDGGGLRLSDPEGDANVTFDNTTISGNTAANNGGGINLYSDDGSFVFRNSTVSGNTATTANGGGVYVRDCDEDIRIQSSTIAFNAAPAGSGGGFFQAAGTTQIQSTIVSGNTASDGNDLAGGANYAFRLAFSLLGDTTIGGTATLVDNGSNLFGVDPLLAPLADNGGPTFTHAIAPGSPALDTGFNFAGSQFDQRGNPFLRTSGAGTDIGAFEYNPPPPVPPLPIVAGAGAGGNGTFVAYNPDGTVKATVEAFDPSVTGGVRVAVGDVTGDGVYDYIAGAGPGAPSVVKVFDGATLQPIAFFLVYETTFTGGVYVASGDIDGDGFAEVVVTPDQGGGPVVAVYSGKSLAGGNAVEIARFNGIQDPEFRGGARVAVGDVTGDGRADVVVAAGFQGGPRISVWESAAVLAGRTTAADTPFANFFAFEDALRNGTFVAVGDLDGDGFGDIIAGAGPDGAPRVVVFDGADLVAGSLTMTASFFAGDNEDRIGVPVAVADFNADGDLDVVTGVGEPDAGAAGTAVSVVRVYPASSLGNDPLDPLATLTPFADFTGGVFVG